MKTPDRERLQLTPVQRKLITAVAAGAAVIATIGFVGSYAAVRTLAEAKNFGTFALFFPIGIDAGILVLLALDLLLTWFRMPLGMLRHTAWLLTVATITFNAAAAWPDPVGTGMHAVIPVLFVVVVEAARHAVGRAADITAGRDMDSVRLSRWLLSPVLTFFLWRRMKLWELRSYDEVIRLEQQRQIERSRLRARYGWRWRSKAPVGAVLALSLTRYGRPVDAPVEGVLDIEHATAGVPPTALATTRPATLELPGTFEDAAEQAIDVVREQSTDTAPTTTVQPGAKPSAAVQPDAEMQPDAHPADPEEAQQQLDADPTDDRDAQPDAPDTTVSQLPAPDDEQLLEEAAELNLERLRVTGKQVPLRVMQKQLSIGQKRAQRFQKQLPKTLAAAVAEAKERAAAKREQGGEG